MTDLVYMIANAKGEEIWIGFNGAGKRDRAKTHRSYGFTKHLVWMPGSDDIETALHDYFADHRIDDGGRSRYRSTDEMYEYAVSSSGAPSGAASSILP